MEKIHLKEEIEREIKALSKIYNVNIMYSTSYTRNGETFATAGFSPGHNGAKNHELYALKVGLDQLQRAMDERRR